MGPSRKGDAILWCLNEFGECLGFGRIVENLSGWAEDNELRLRMCWMLGIFCVENER